MSYEPVHVSSLNRQRLLVENEGKSLVGKAPHPSPPGWGLGAALYIYPSQIFALLQNSFSILRIPLQIDSERF
jgi:hypothetical protein